MGTKEKLINHIFNEIRRLEGLISKHSYEIDKWDGRRNELLELNKKFEHEIWDYHAMISRLSSMNIENEEEGDGNLQSG